MVILGQETALPFNFVVTVSTKYRALGRFTRAALI